MAAKPKVMVLGTGGTISYVTDDRLHLATYSDHGTTVGVAELLERIPEAGQLARVESEDFFREGYLQGYLGPGEWPALARRCTELLRTDPDLAGIAITHGSAFVEETAYFLHLTVKSDKPVVLTASLRPSTGLSTDADSNLLDAIRIAAAPQAVGRGVLLVLNNEIHSARDVIKRSAFRLEAFGPGELGFLGYSDSDGQVVFYRSVERAHTTRTPFDLVGVEQLPRVEILFVYPGVDARMVDAVVQTGPAGLVIATGGGGSMPPDFRGALARAVRDGIPVVLSSRTGNGRLLERPAFQELGFIVGDNLAAQKARILLMVGLSVTKDRDELQDYFRTY
ncbi:MAG: asparaginase [Chloroflexi bacterium]|nr:asparaginase [Chloroflexota bacterium]